MTPITWAVIAIAIIIIYGPIQALLESVARQRLFNLRDQLFNQALDGTTSFEDPQYQQARDRINCFIRFTHSLKWYTFMLANRITLDGDGEQKEEATEENPLYGQFRQEVAKTMLWLMVFRSPLLLIIGTVYAIYMLATFKVNELRRRVRDATLAMERGARMA